MDGTPMKATDQAEPAAARQETVTKLSEGRMMAATPTSPLAVQLPELPPLAGVRLGATAAGIRYQGRTDLVMVELAPGSTVAGVFTRKQMPGCAGGVGTAPASRAARRAPW